MRRIGFAFVVAAMVLPGTADAQDMELVGCYDLTIGEWAPALPEGSPSWYVTPPPRIELTDTFAARHGVPDSLRRAVTPAPGVMPSVHSMAFWSMPSPDTVALVWSNGFTGVRLRVGRTETGLAGNARSFTDVVGDPRHEAPALARPVACDAPMAAAWRERYPYGRGFLLATGDSLLLDAPLPVGVTGDSVGRAAFMLDVVPGGVLAGATSVVVALDREGNISSIRANFPSDARLENLVILMEAVWGPASTVWSDTTATGALRSGAEWDDPLIMKRLGRNTMGNGAIEVVVYMASRNVIRGARGRLQ
jgi:hypothetical protein